MVRQNRSRRQPMATVSLSWMLATACVWLAVSSVQSTKAAIMCKLDEQFVHSETQFNFDCSDKRLDWPLLPSLMEYTFNSNNLNLARNNFTSISATTNAVTGEDDTGCTVPDYAFDLFKNLDGTLNLSDNGLTAARSHAFFYAESTAPHPQPLRLTALDLSHNRLSHLPWQALRKLAWLERLVLAANPIERLDMGDLRPLTTNNKSTTTSAEAAFYFVQLAHLDLSRCRLHTVQADVLELMPALRALDLSGNRIRQLSADVGRVSWWAVAANFRLDVRDNPLECDCRLLWLKLFLKAKSVVANETSGVVVVGAAEAARDAAAAASCSINTLVDEQPTLLVSTIELMISSDERNKPIRRHRIEQSVRAKSRNNETSANSTKPTETKPKTTTVTTTMPTIQKRTNEKRHQTSALSVVPLLTLQDHEFICGLNLSAAYRNLTDTGRPLASQRVELSCTVRAFPQPHLTWNQENRALLKFYTDQHGTAKFRQEEIVSAPSPTSGVYEYEVRSRLLIAYGDYVAAERYSCRAQFVQQQQQAPNLSSIGGGARPRHLHAVAHFHINTHLANESAHDEADWWRQQKSSQPDSDGPIMPDTGDSYRLVRKEGVIADRPYIYWVILVTLVLFSLLVVLFASCCVVRNARRNKQDAASAAAAARDQSYYAHVSTASNYSSINKRSAIYLASNSSVRGGGTVSSGCDPSTVQLLKPDVIREHHETSSIYMNINRSGAGASTLLSHSTPNTASSRRHKWHVPASSATPPQPQRQQRDADYDYELAKEYTVEPTSRRAASAAVNAPYGLRRHRDHNNNNNNNSYAYEPSNPAESTLIDDHDRPQHRQRYAPSSLTASSSRSFEENIEEYQDPEFDDLRKPASSKLAVVVAPAATDVNNYESMRQDLSQDVSQTVELAQKQQQKLLQHA